MRMSGFLLTIFCVASAAMLVASQGVQAWSNSGQSRQASEPEYGTHDWIAENAAAFLPEGERGWLERNRAAFLFGTELPDFERSDYYPDGIGDQMKHHVYFNEDGTIMDGVAAQRVQEEYYVSAGYLRNGDEAQAALHAGVMAHYVGDLAVFGHVMGYYTSWMDTRASDDGSESYYNHMTYESYVNVNTSTFESEEWSPYLAFDGEFENLSPYQLAIRVAFNVTFNPGGYMNCVWIDEWMYEQADNETACWGDAGFHDRTGELLNLAVNSLADALHGIYVESGIGEQAEEPEPEDDILHIGQLWYLIPFSIVLAVVMFVFVKYIMKADLK